MDADAIVLDLGESSFILNSYSLRFEDRGSWKPVSDGEEVEKVSPLDTSLGRFYRVRGCSSRLPEQVQLDCFRLTGNSGLLIMRNTPWLREFVSKWWTTVDRQLVIFLLLFSRALQICQV